jgi:drug/metabolite transporter (DMT)-like permease
MNKYQPSVSAVQAAVIYTLEPLFATSWAMILPLALSTMCGVVYGNEIISWSLILGGGTIILANVLALYPQPKELHATDAIPYGLAE